MKKITKDKYLAKKYIQTRVWRTTVPFMKLAMKKYKIEDKTVFIDFACKKLVE
jgi:hypothetical protein